MDIPVIRGPVAGILVALLMHVGLLSTPVPGAAQAGTPRVDARGGLVLDAYRFGDEEATGIRSLSLITLPIRGAVALGQRGTLEVRGAFARGSMEAATGENVEISGLTDTEIRLGLRMAGATVFQVQGIAVLPTGHSTQTAEEAAVAGVVAADLLPFQISNWGSGGGGGVHTSAARSFGDTGLGMSASYVVGREFEPIQEEPFGYRPGNQLRIRGALDHNVNPSSKLTLTVTLERYSDDSLDGTNLFRSGNRVQAVGSYGFAPSPRNSALVYAGVFHRSQGTALLELAPDVPSQQLLLAGGGIRLPMDWGVVVPSVDARVFRSGDGVGQGWLTGLGVSAEMPAGGLVLVPSVRGRFGSVLVREGSQSGITGLELSMTARFRGR